MKCGRRYRGLTLRNAHDLEVIDSELRLPLAIRRMVRGAEGRAPSTAGIDELLDERAARAQSCRTAE